MRYHGDWRCVPKTASKRAENASGVGEMITSERKELPEPGPAPDSRFLDAIDIALIQSEDGSPWYTSTKHLQLASLHLCAMCRREAKLSVRVHKHTPRTLWVASPRHHNLPRPRLKVVLTKASHLASWKKLGKGTKTRVPRYQPRVVTWSLPLALSSDMRLLSPELECLFIGDIFKGRVADGDFVFPTGLKELVFMYLDQPLDRITWPVLLQRLAFGDRFNQPIEQVIWPSALKHLTFGNGFHQDISGVAWPRTLEKLHLGDWFNRSIEGVDWSKTCLRELYFGHGFNHPLSRVGWPKSVVKLTLGDSFNCSLDAISHLPSLESLTIGDKFNQPIDQVVWLTSLKQLRFGARFDRPVDEVAWPASLRELSFGPNFNQGIESVSWPADLRELGFGFNFDQPIQKVQWPDRLERLRFGYCFNRSVSRVRWPATLKHLEFGHLFNRAIDNTVFPDGLQRLAFGMQFDHRIGTVKWPSGLRYLALGWNFTFSLDRVREWPRNLETIHLDFGPDRYRPSLRHVRWPEGLKELRVSPHVCMRGVILPEGVRVFSG